MHDHVELAGVHEHVADDLERAQHFGLGPAADPGERGILVDLHGESTDFQDLGHEFGPAPAPEVLGRAALELETHVVFLGPLPDQGLHGAEVEAESRGQAHVIVRDHEIVALGKGRVRGRF